MLFAKISTAKTVTFGPILAADGTMSSGSLAYTDAKIFKNGTDGALNASATFTHKYEGVYALALTASDLDAVGTFEIVLNKNPLSAARVEITVLAANVYDWLFGTTAPLTAMSDSSGVTTLLSRIVGTLDTGTHKPQSGDAYARIGAPAGASLIADLGTATAATQNIILAVKAITDVLNFNANDDLLVTLDGEAVTLAASQPNYAPSKAGDAMTLTAAYDSAKTAAPASTALSTAVWTNTKAGYLDAAISGISGGLDAAGVRSAIGLASANLDTQLSAISGYVDCLPASWVVPAAVGDKMDIVDAPNATAVTALQSGLATASSLTALAGKFTGITSLTNWLRGIFRKDAMDSTAKTEIGGTFNETTDSLEAIRDRGDAAWTTGSGGSGGVVGPGSIPTTITVTLEGLPLDGVSVWVSTDANGSNVVAGTLHTDMSGQAAFMLDAGTYYVWRKLAGTNFTNPQEITVSA